MNRTSLLSTLSVIVLGPTMVLAAPNETVLRDWKLVDAQRVRASSLEVSTPGYSTSDWIKATVPGTVLTSMVDAHLFPEPLYGENNRTIPESLCRTAYWYRTEVDVPKASPGRHTWIEFKGINYLADVSVNGQPVGHISGAFTRGLFDITRMVAGRSKAAIAVYISPPAHPGKPEEQTVAAGTGRNGGVIGADGPTFLATVGWDWIPGIRDRDMGIWEPVTLRTTGPARLSDPVVRCAFDGHELDHARLTSSVTVSNLEGAPFKGVLRGRFDNGVGGFSVPISLIGNESKSFSFEQVVTHPKLWWPNGYGPQNLYHLHLSLESGAPSDVADTSFGIRSMKYFREGGADLTIIVNGVPIFCKGGNWGMDEAMKRSPRSRLEAQIRLHHDANVNMIRNWIGMSTQEDFYDLCDQYGILVWDDFWLANPSDGPVPDSPQMFLENAQEKIVRYRNHPSIAVWCGRNEGDPPKQIDTGLAHLISNFDPDRIYQKHSAAYNGVGGGGPYSMADPTRYFTFKDAFHTEVGAPSIPTLEAVHVMMPQKDWWPINDDWAEHDLCRGAQRGDRFPADIAKRYGPVTDLESFVRDSQMADYETYRAIFEGRNSRLFDPATGVLLWMSNPCQPSFVWQLYSYDLEPDSAEFATQKACEPIHAQYNPSTHRLEVINTLPNRLNHYRLEWTRMGFDGHRIDGNSIPVQTHPSCATALLDLGTLPNFSQPFLLNLLLYDGQGKLCSRNFYWESENEDFTGLRDLHSVDLSVSNYRMGSVKGKPRLSFTLRNPGKTIALLAHVQLRRADGQRVLPVFYSDNYVTLMPGESRELKADFERGASGSELPKIHLDGWNVTAKEVGGG